MRVDLFQDCQLESNVLLLHAVAPVDALELPCAHKHQVSLW